MDIREFLESRLAEDQKIAEDASALDSDWPFWIDVDDEADYRAASAFRERLGPARVLRDVEAARRMIAALDRRMHFLDNTEWYGCRSIDSNDGPTGEACTCGRDAEVLEQLRLMAATWSDHPDFDPAWTPEATT